MRAVQKRLVELGLMEGPGDGTFGKATAAAVGRLREYLEQQGDPFVIEDTDAIPIALQKKLDGGLPVFRAEIASGSKDKDEVRRLQRRLNRLATSAEDHRRPYGKGTGRPSSSSRPTTPALDRGRDRPPAPCSRGPVACAEYRLNISWRTRRLRVQAGH